jgi:hypothetical protein
MTKRIDDKALSRRHFFKLTGGATLAAAGMGLLPFRKLLGPMAMSSAEAAVTDPPDLYFAGTDGWIYMDPTHATYSASLGGVKTHPDDLAPAPFTTYIFGFRNVTWLDAT